MKQQVCFEIDYMKTLIKPFVIGICMVLYLDLTFIGRLQDDFLSSLTPINDTT
jgi:hypothetical protein